MTDKLFAYGTIMQGKEATHILVDYMMFKVKGQRFNFPVIQEVPEEWSANTRIHGCLIDVDEEDWPAYDMYEGVANGLYVRQQVEVLDNETLEPTTAWVYVGGPMIVNEPIPDGKWNE